MSPLLALPAAAAGQHAPGDAAEHGWWWLGARAIGLLTHATPALFGRDLTEVYLTQPSVSAHAEFGHGRVRLGGMLDFEGITLRRGELNAGIWGEGYVDRRHPHTLLHELVATLRLAGGAAAVREATVTAGKGFVPFGTDDPGVRPFAKYPANHHLAQVLERLLVIGAYRHRRATLEVALFNGDEPSGPWHLGTPRRFADSWAARATLSPARGMEVAVSRAVVASPEFPAGSGLDHHKWSAALRQEAALGGEARGYGLLEWARTDEYSASRPSFSFGSWLAEGQLSRGHSAVALRYEQTVRPEEERLSDPFRSPRPHADANILGVTRWRIVSARVGRTLAAREGLGLHPFLEVARLRAAETLRPSLLVPADFYGSERMWSVSAGVGIAAGPSHRRMGRYGAALPTATLTR
jgi:hypothetical protein